MEQNKRYCNKINTDSIWDEFNIKNVKLKNRIVRAATNEHLGTLDGVITDAYIDVYKNLADSGVGLIITSHMAIDKMQRADLTHICINDPENFEKLKLLTKEVHKTDSKIICQISYGGYRALKVAGKRAMTPSAMEETTEMTLGDIDDCINNYIKTIKLIKKAGFDGVELHLAHGYLLSEFLDSFYNKRDDLYGGTVENRYRIVHQILSGIHNLCFDSNFLIIAKIDSTSKSGNPLFLKDQIEVCKLLEKDGIDAIEVSGCDFRKYKQDTPYFLNNALMIKEMVSVPIILVGGFRNQAQMSDAISKRIDLISISRPFIADKNFMEKLRNNQPSRCISCSKCFDIYKTQFKHCIFDKDIDLQLYENFHK